MSDLKIVLVETLANNTIALVKLSDDRVFKLSISAITHEASADTCSPPPIETSDEWSAIKRLLSRLRDAAAELNGRFRA